MKIDVRTAVVLSDKTGQKLLLLRRSATKKLLPNLITGIGGKVELEIGEGEDIEKSLLRELAEEVPQIHIKDIENFKARLVTSSSRNNTHYVIFWFTGRLSVNLTDLSCEDGVLEWHSIDNLPIDGMTNAAKGAIPFMSKLQDIDGKFYDGVYNSQTGELLVSK
jgi:ADP-ribose pyrophosphatase YjhB (NUDIX family)